MALGTWAEGFTDSPGRALRLGHGPRGCTSPGRRTHRDQRVGGQQAWEQAGKPRVVRVGRQLSFRMRPLQVWSPRRLESLCTAPLPALHHGCLSTSYLHGDLIRT